MEVNSAAFTDFGAMKTEFDTMKTGLGDADMAKQLAELTQLVNSQKVQQAEEMEDLKLANAVQIRELRKENNFSADCFPTKKDQTLSDTDPVQFVSHKRDIVRPSLSLSMPKFNIQEMRGNLERSEVLCRMNNIRTDSAMFVALFLKNYWGFRVDVLAGW